MDSIISQVQDLAENANEATRRDILDSLRNLPLPDSQQPHREVSWPMALYYLGSRHDRALCGEHSHSHSINFPID
jgi:hypothetical protein